MSPRQELPPEREIHIHDSAGNSPDFIVYSMSRRQQLGASAAKKGDIISIEQKIDGRYFCNYYEILSDGYLEYTRGGHTYNARKIETKEEAEKLAEKWQRENREMQTVCLVVREARTWELHVRVPVPAAGEKDAVAAACEKFYDMGGHGFLDEIKTVNSSFGIEDSYKSDSPAKFKFDEEGDLVYLSEEEK